MTAGSQSSSAPGVNPAQVQVGLFLVNLDRLPIGVEGRYELAASEPVTSHALCTRVPLYKVLGSDTHRHTIPLKNGHRGFEFS
jgi:hypothetical protein